MTLGNLHSVGDDRQGAVLDMDGWMWIDGVIDLDERMD